MLGKSIVDTPKSTYVFLPALVCLGAKLDHVFVSCCFVEDLSRLGFCIT